MVKFNEISAHSRGLRISWNIYKNAIKKFHDVEHNKNKLTTRALTYSKFATVNN
jgi:hypothetical protein